jgi:hypothetical protein
VKEGEHQGAAPPPNAEGAKEAEWRRVGCFRAFFFFFFKNSCFCFLQIEIHPFSICIFYFLSSLSVCDYARIPCSRALIE